MGTKTKTDQKRLDTLANDCIIFTDRNGRVLNRSGNPFSSTLAMEYRGRGLKIEFRVQTSGYSNGSCQVRVWNKRSAVLVAQGNYIRGAYNIVAKKYVPGPWEKIVAGSQAAAHAGRM